MIQLQHIWNTFKPPQVILNLLERGINRDSCKAICGLRQAWAPLNTLQEPFYNLHLNQYKSCYFVIVISFGNKGEEQQGGCPPVLGELWGAHTAQLTSHCAAEGYRSTQHAQ